MRIEAFKEPLLKEPVPPILPRCARGGRQPVRHTDFVLATPSGPTLSIVTGSARNETETVRSQPLDPRPVEAVEHAEPTERNGSHAH